MGDYLATVERFFVVLRRRGLMLSPRDISRVQQWRDDRVPVDGVCRGLAAGAAHFRQVNGDEAALPDSLQYYLSFVEDEVERLRAEPAPAAPSVPVEPSDVSDALAELAWIGQREADPLRRHAYRAAWRALKTADTDRATALECADRVAVDALIEALSDSARKKILLEVDRKLQPEKANLGVRGAAVRHRAILEELVVAQYGLVRLRGDHG